MYGKKLALWWSIGQLVKMKNELYLDSKNIITLMMYTGYALVYYNYGEVIGRLQGMTLNTKNVATWSDAKNLKIQKNLINVYHKQVLKSSSFNFFWHE